MRIARAPVLASALAAVLLPACSDDGGTVTAGSSSLESTASPETTGAPSTTSPGPAGIDEAALTESWGCGYALHASDAAQTEGVSIRWTAPEASFEEQPLPADDVTLPSDDWEAEVWLGADLFANWCNDVIEPDTPEPRVDETWTITEGSVTFTGTGGSCGTAEVSATLTGGVATTEDGVAVPLDDIELTNTTWGCFAG
jgi:hypothetical protein